MFQGFDSFLNLTSMGKNCWKAYWRLGKATQNIIYTNVINSEQVGLNIMVEFFTIWSNLMVFYADYFFTDYLSLAFHIGDTIYRIIIIQNEHDFSIDLDTDV